MIVWVASYPRSGNTWFNIVLGRLANVPRVEVYDVPRADRAELVTALAHVGVTHAVKTHELPAGDRNPAIYLIRDGRDALVSHAHFVLWRQRRISTGADRGAFERVLRELITESVQRGVAGWSRHVHSWMWRSALTVVVRYEELIAHPADVVRRAWHAVTGDVLPASDVPLPTFAQLHAINPSFYRSGQVGGWREEMSDDLHRLFWSRHGRTMRRLGYGDSPVPPRRGWVRRLWPMSSRRSRPGSPGEDPRPS